jgi:hypothetical protein
MGTPVKSKTNPETYIIRAGTILYRGDTPFYIANKDFQSRSLEKTQHSLVWSQMMLNNMVLFIVGQYHKILNYYI